jgi:LmbE family N-acetylglucosaminyl deacetylase
MRPSLSPSRILAVWPRSLRGVFPLSRLAPVRPIGAEASLLARQALALLLLCPLALVFAACAPQPALSLLPGSAPSPTASVAPPAQEVVLSAGDRVLILAPHPDDETIATGGIIQKAEAMGLPVKVVYLTYGDANQWSFLVYRKRPEVGARAVESMGEVRRTEAISATHVLGLQRDQLVFLGYPDFGNLQIWDRHWGDAPPYEGLLTGTTDVPYPDAYRPGAPYRGQEVLSDVEAVLRDFQPTKVFVSSPADRNPDHLALYLFTRVALWDLAGELHPALYPYLVHYSRWPEPRGYHPTAPLAPPADLAGEASWLSEPLSGSELAVKRDALQQHKTQYQTNRRYLDSFLRTNELFGDLPTVSLVPGSPGVSLSQQALFSGDDVGDELTEEERAKFVGLEARNVRLEGSDLVFEIELSSALPEGVQASAYFFGYRPDVAFASMPKLHVEFSDIGNQVYDGQKKMGENTVSVTRAPGQMTIRVPMALLGDPQRLLFHARTHLGNVPLDGTEWRVLSLPGDRQ